MRSSIPFSGKLDERKNVKNNPRPFEELPPEVQEMLLRRRPQASKTGVLQILEEKHMLSILLYLDRMSPVMKSDIYNDISRASTMSAKLDDLRDLGLVEFFSTVRASTNVIVITDKGREVAAIIKDIVNIIDGDDSGSERTSSEGETDPVEGRSAVDRWMDDHLQ